MKTTKKIVNISKKTQAAPMYIIKYFTELSSSEKR